MTAELPTIGFLVAAGREVGGGHLMRCLAIAGVLDGLGAEVHFFSGELPAPLAARCMAEGIPVETLSPLDTETTVGRISRIGVDVLVVDGYRFDESWRQSLRRSDRKLVVLDDMNDPPVHTADAIINALPGADQLGYGDCAPQSEHWLGPKYAALALAFAKPVNLTPESRNGMLVSFGASDPAGYTLPLIRALQASMPTDPPMPIRIVTGPAMDSKLVQRIRSQLSSDDRFEHHHDCRDMRELMVRSGLGVSAAGSTVYELAACGVPTVAVAVSRNQQLLAASLKRQATWCHIIKATPNEPKQLAQKVWDTWFNLSWRQAAMQEARHWLDGQGSRRLAERILKLAREAAS